MLLMTDLGVVVDGKDIAAGRAIGVRRRPPHLGVARDGAAQHHATQQHERARLRRRGVCC